MELTTLKLDMLDDHPKNPRGKLTDIPALAASIAELGVRQPIAVRVSPLDSSRYQIEAGHRRVAAAKLAKLTEIPAVIFDDTDDDAAVLALLATQDQHVPFTAQERDRGYQGILAMPDLGSVSRATGVSLKTLTDARKGRDRIDKGKLEQVSFDQLAILGTFADDPERFSELEAAIGTYDFSWKAQRFEHQRQAAEKFEIDKAAADELGAIEAEYAYDTHKRLEDWRCDGELVAPEDVPRGELLWDNDHGTLRYFTTTATGETQGWADRYGRSETPEDREKRERRRAEFEAEKAALEAAQAHRFAFLRTQVAKMPATLLALVAGVMSRMGDWDEFGLQPKQARALLGSEDTPKAHILINAALLAELDRWSQTQGNPEDVAVYRTYIETLEQLGYQRIDWDDAQMVDFDDGAEEDEQPHEAALREINDTITEIAEGESCPESIAELEADAECAKHGLMYPAEVAVFAQRLKDAGHAEWGESGKLIYRATWDCENLMFAFADGDASLAGDTEAYKADHTAVKAALAGDEE